MPFRQLLTGHALRDYTLLFYGLRTAPERMHRVQTLT